VSSIYVADFNSNTIYIPTNLQIKPCNNMVFALMNNQTCFTSTCDLGRESYISRD